MSDIIEAAARALEKQASFYADEARQAVMIVTPLIRSQVLEEAAMAIEANEEDYLVRMEVAGAIRALKEQP